MSAQPDGGTLPTAFQQTAASTPRRVRRKKCPPPFSIRLKPDDLAAIRQKAGTTPLSAYCRAVLLADAGIPIKRQFNRAADQAAMARVLTTLGRSHLSSNMNQISARANAGIIETTPALIQELQDACEAIRVMRDTLIMALGLKVRDGSL